MMLPRDSSDIQTIAANRITGCGSPLPKRMGFAFYVNSWMSSDLKIKVGWARVCVCVCVRLVFGPWSQTLM
jgi:hypothetical protein